MTAQTLERSKTAKKRKKAQMRTLNGAVPPLESGDHLTRAEFERRYELHPEIKKAELIEGVVYVASPIRVEQHGNPHVAASSFSQDMNLKKRVYARNGLPEYIVFQVYERQVAWFVLREDGYQQLAPGEDGVLRSEIFPGLWLDPAAFWAADMMKVLAVAQQGISAPEHQAYVERLNERAKSR